MFGHVGKLLYFCGVKEVHIQIKMILLLLKKNIQMLAYMKTILYLCIHKQQTL